MEIMKKFITFISIMFLGFALSAQSADVITNILDSSEMTAGQACYISAVSQGFISDDASFEDAVLALAGKGQLKDILSANDPVRLDDLSAIYTKMFNVKGGLFYMITNGSPRYAFKHLKSQGLIAPTSDPSKILSGREAMSLFTKCSMRYGEAQFTDEL